MKSSNQKDDWFTCPVCGEVVAGSALACPACGADDETGWSEDAEYDGVDLDDEAFGDAPPNTPRTNKTGFRVTAIVLALMILLLILMGVW